MKENNYHALTPSDKALEIIKEFFQKKGNKEARNTAEKLLKEHLVETADGSYTLRSNSVYGKSETMHTYHGAFTESREKFAKSAHLEGKEEVKVLDICSGIGYNAAACIESVDDSVKIQVDMLEISKETLGAALFIESSVKSHEIIKKAIENHLFEKGILGFKFQNEEIPNRIEVNIYIEDARKVVQDLGNEKYDAIFLDPFSPLKSPELYSAEFFMKLKNLLKDDGLILTYTSAAPVRSAMVLAGLHVGEGPLFGRKSGGTVASKSLKMIQKDLNANDERMIALSDAGIPFRDPELNGSGEEMIKRRENERKSARRNTKMASTVKTPVFLNREIEDIKLEKRVIRSIKFMGIENLKSSESKFIVCPQYDECICNCGNSKLEDSKGRINEMSKRLLKIIDKNNFNII